MFVLFVTYASGLAAVMLALALEPKMNAKKIYKWKNK